MAILNDILYKVPLIEVSGNTALEISLLAIDSRLVQANTLFIAMKGDKLDGHEYIETAIQKGATAIVCEKMPATISSEVTYIVVKNSHHSAGIIAANFYGNPSQYLKLTGVTGTNGKTTIATLLFKLFRQLGYKCGLISTVQNQIDDQIIPSTHTTPDALHINALLKQMLDAGCSHVFMECSSHAIHQQRIAGLHFAGALFSNITHDHLDYHKTFDEYIRVKKQFFDFLPATAFAISNKDDKRGTVMLQNTQAAIHYYSLTGSADFKGKILNNSLTGLQMTINETEVHFRLIGAFNAYNLLAVYGAAICLGEDKQRVLTVLSNITGAEGRFDYLVSKHQIIGIVDYAHTPDALENVLSTIHALRKGYERIITVVGCGGDRDTTKRPVMAKIAASFSDYVLLTSDNPRTEDPLSILAQMETGLDSAAKRKTITQPNRQLAIEKAVQLAGPEDIILVAGKGHEKYQDINGIKHPFDDKAILSQTLNLKTL